MTTRVDGLEVTEVEVFVISAEPRIQGGEVRVGISNANRAVGGIRTLQIVDLLGNVWSNLLPQIRYVDAQQTITVNTNSWPRGGYYLLVRDDRNAGTVNLLKIH
ncbi:MAG: hypothetical protein SGJ05_12255 [bacterium]|nr:hypothetical protein [bacterium]